MFQNYLVWIYFGKLIKESYISVKFLKLVLSPENLENKPIYNYIYIYRYIYELNSQKFKLSMIK